MVKEAKTVGIVKVEIVRIVRNKVNIAVLKILKIPKRGVRADRRATIVFRIQVDQALNYSLIIRNPEVVNILSDSIRLVNGFLVIVFDDNHSPSKANGNSQVTSVRNFKEKTLNDYVDILISIDGFKTSVRVTTVNVTP